MNLGQESNVRERADGRCADSDDCILLEIENAVSEARRLLVFAKHLLCTDWPYHRHRRRCSHRRQHPRRPHRRQHHIVVVILVVLIVVMSIIITTMIVVISILS